VRVLVWHVHGSYQTALVQGPHTYLVPVTPDRGPDGRGRADTWAWPASTVEVTPEQLREEPIDAVILQRPHELELVRAWTGREPGGQLPALYLEHNTPRGDVTEWRHPLADRSDIPIVHVTSFNAAMWDNGAAPVRVIEHGVIDPGYRYSGEWPSLGVCINEPIRRSRVAGTDLAARIAASVPVELYGMGLAGVAEHTGLRPGRELAGVNENLPQARLHERLPRHRAYLHPYRWTSLGLALIEAMTLGMPVLVLAATAAPEAVPPDAGVVSSDVDTLAAAARRLAANPDEAQTMGLAARNGALRRFGLARFLADWDRALKEVS
jgi:glycosyltransferase involved in cell wall biosynthesis